MRPRRAKSVKKLIKYSQIRSLGVLKVFSRTHGFVYISAKIPPKHGGFSLSEIDLISWSYHFSVGVIQPGDKRVTNSCHGICHARQNRVILADQPPMMTVPAADCLSTPIDSTTSIVGLLWDDLKAKSRVTKPCHDLSHICHVTNITYEWI